MKGMSVEHLSAKATVIYTRTVDRAASFLKTKKELEAKSQLQKDRLLTALSQKAPVDFLNEAIDKRIVLAQQQPKTKQRKPLSSSVNAAAAFVSTTANTSMNKDDFAPFVSEPLTAKGTGKFARPGPVQNKGKGKGVSSAKGNQKSKGKGKSINIDSDNWRSNSWRHHPGTTLQLNSMGLLRVESPSKSQFFTSVGKEKAKEERLETPAKEKTKARPRGSQRDPRSDTATFPAFDQGHVHLWILLPTTVRCWQRRGVHVFSWEQASLGATSWGNSVDSWICFTNACQTCLYEQTPSFTGSRVILPHSMGR